MNMIYRIDLPDNYQYARFGTLGTWEPDPSPGLCIGCGMSRQKRVPPQIIEWLPGSDIVGDFAWRSVSFELVAKFEIAKELKRKFSGFEIHKITMHQEPSINPPQNPKRAKKKRIFLPYTGPEICELWITSWVNLNVELSNLELEKKCKICSYNFYKPQKEGVVIDRNSWDGSDFFRPHQFSGLILCTERVKEFIERENYSNVTFKTYAEWSKNRRSKNTVIL